MTAASAWDRWTKRIVVASALLAVLFQAWYSSGAHPYLAWTLLVAPLMIYVAGRFSPEATAGIVFAFGYAVPTLLIRITGFQGAFQSVWSATVLAALAGTLKTSWQLPRWFRLSLIAWGLAVGLTWPIVALRELDWMPWVLSFAPPTRNPAAPAIPTALWIAGIAQTHLVGIVWIDWLYGTFARGGTSRFERLIIRPALIAALFAAGLALYQGFVDLEYPRQGLWAYIGRASGAMDDGNASGVLGAMWSAIPFALTVGTTAGASAVAAAVSAALIAGIWQTGSRTAIACATIALGGVVHAAIARSRSRARAFSLAAVVAALGVAAALPLFRADTINPLSRMREFERYFAEGGWRRIGRELVDRNGYGAAAAMMIRDEPLQGVGVGSFQAMSSDYAKVATGHPLPIDNAQNWFRHQIAELGILGAAGPLMWSMLLFFALFSRPPDTCRRQATIVKYTILAFGLVSIVGMPSQNLFVAMTMWTMCAWLLMLAAPLAEGEPLSSRTGLCVAVVLTGVLVTGLTWEAAWRELRPPFRAARFDYPYIAGLYAPMEEPAGTTVAARHAITAPSARTRTLKLTLWVEHPDADRQPVRVEAWVNNERIVRGRFARNVPLIRFVDVPAGRRFVLETRVDRTFSMPDRGQPEVGLNLTWEYVGTSIPTSSESRSR